MGRVEGCAACAKYLLIVFNIIFFLVGAGLLAVGLWVLLSPYKIDILAVLDNSIITTGVYFIIALGAFIFIVGFLGCCGACCESKLLLVLYFIIVLIVFLAQIAICAAVVAFKDEVDDFITNQLNETMDEYESLDSENTFSVGWNAIQLVLKCCGHSGYQNWADSAWAGTETYTIDGQTVTLEFPVTCCKVDDPYAIVNGDYPDPLNVTACVMEKDSNFLNEGGCYESLQDYVIDQAIYVGAVGIGLTVFEIFCMIFALCVCRGISKAADVV
ncbi:tetraspanin-18-like [Amphiura filiformis]|uniref:tetraspanin-18-like n=1 Tax=Amphiura filiformis TaxID=82378 RepID=UPI003B223ED9